MKRTLSSLAFLTLAISALTGIPAASQEVNPDSWAATDALGRKVRSYDKAPAKRDGKFVAIFYWTWHTFHHDDKYPVYNISEILRKNPEAIKDYNHPAWGPTGPHFYYWEKPLFGYYQTTDKWVLRKHAEMLAAAGIDAVFFDCTNGHQTWIPSYEALMETWDQAQKDGVKVPKIAFILPFWPTDDSRISLRQLYNDVYKPGRYKNLWFIWKGKPCIMGYPDNLTDEPTDKEIASFFTFRPGQPDYVDGPTRNDQWGWLENYPQHGYVKTTGADGKASYEQVTVGVAQNTNPDRKGHCGAFNTKDAYGRNFSIRNGFDPRPDGYLYGWNIEEQWERAYEIDPELVFVTGWNEYIAGKWLPKDGWNGDPFSFVDQYNWVCSRDIEPNAGWGDKGDVYYLQLVDNVRKFKGMVPIESASAPKSVKINHFSDWDDVKPSFAAYKGNTFHRDNVGAGNTHYTDDSGRNDIVGAKVARDNDNIYFYVETADVMTPKTDPHWMRLFIDIDRDKSTGWYGYDFVVNRVSPSKSKAVVERNIQGSWIWEKSAEVTKEGDIMDFYVSGDSAPFGRFNYVYTAER